VRAGRILRLAAAVGSEPEQASEVWTWTQLARLSDWEPGERGRDGDGEWFWLDRAISAAGPDGMSPAGGRTS
jgi:hypothetical protein